MSNRKVFLKMDLCWVKINMANWDPPDRPLDLPDPADYDAAALSEARPRNILAATRESATCVACLQTDSQGSEADETSQSRVGGVPESIPSSSTS